ncbi:MAG: FAD-binding protein [Clostridia bacterium]|nr:FAD-binding protein [Clostridia bacterium]
MQQSCYDIAIIGAGPAGTVFAKEIANLRPELKIILIDGQSSEKSKPCGGLLAPDAQKLLARFDLVLPKTILEDPQIFAVETIDIEKRLVRYYQRHYLNMDRYAFDSWLLSLVPKHVEIQRGKCIKIEKTEGNYMLSLKNEEDTLCVNAKFIVGADGGNSIARRTFFTPMKVQYVAIQQWFKNKGQRLPYYSCIFDAKTSDSCSWTIHKGSYVLFGGAFEKKGCRAAFDLQKSRLENFLGNSFGDPIKTEACLVSSPRGMKDFCTGNKDIFLIGEAAGFISASSFEGISSAMLSGKLLADAFANNSNRDIQKVYRKNTRTLRLKLYTKSIKRAILCNPLTRGMIMRSGIQSITPYVKNHNHKS